MLLWNFEKGFISTDSCIPKVKDARGNLRSLTDSKLGHLNPLDAMDISLKKHGLMQALGIYIYIYIYIY